MTTDKNYSEKWQTFVQEYKQLSRLYRSIVKKTVCDAADIAHSTFAAYIDGSRVPSTELTDIALEVMTYVKRELLTFEQRFKADKFKDQSLKDKVQSEN